MLIKNSNIQHINLKVKNGEKNDDEINSEKDNI